MNNLRLSLRRIVGLAAAVIAGTAATLAFASPASAHHTDIVGATECDSTTGEWVVDWTITSAGDWDPLYKIIEGNAAPTGSTLTGLVMDTFQSVSTAFTARQVLPGDAGSATLTIRAEWGNQNKNQQTGLVDFGGDTCQQDQPKPTASFSPACDGTVTVTLTNDADATKAADFTVTGADGFTEDVTVNVGASTDDLVVPAADAAAITVKVGQATIGEYSWAEPDDCAPLNVATRSDCTSLTIVLENPQGNRAIAAKVTSGGKNEDLSVPPGELKEITFPATEGATASVLINGANEPVTVAWEDSGDCTTPPPDLPETGAQLGGMIGLGAAMIGLGAAVVLVFRRRRAMNTF